MRRRTFLAGVGASATAGLAGCAGDADDAGADEPAGDDDEPAGDADDGTDDSEAADGDRGETASDGEESGTDSNGVPGRIDPVGHVVDDEEPFYSFGHVSPDGTLGLLGAHGREGSQIASTLVDLSALDSPEIVHHLPPANDQTRCNDVKFDPDRDLYYRSQEADDLGGDQTWGKRGVEVVDFGWGEASLDEPAVIAQLDVPPVGVHKLTTHPDEELLYLVDISNSDVGVVTVDVSEPESPEIVHEVGPTGGCHDVEYDPVRELLHAAYISGEAEGYVVYDAADPRELEPIGEFRYADQPDYETVGEPGFQSCHQAHPDPERDLVVVGDELATGVPGGKHLFDIGWEAGSPEEPVPIGFTHSPDAREMGPGEEFWWTTHFHDVVPMGETTLLVDGGYRQGVWVCDITDPRNPEPTERYATVEGADERSEHRGPLSPIEPPFAWSAVYNEAREFVFVSDSTTGAYTMSLSAEPARGDDGRGPDGHYDLAEILGEEP